jgi:ligand-binding sensor domain-containing protein
MTPVSRCVWRSFSCMATSLPRSPVISLAQTSDGDIWMGTRDAGLFRMSGSRILPITRGLPDPKINCLLAAPDGELLVGTDNGAVRSNGAELESKRLDARN